MKSNWIQKWCLSKSSLGTLTTKSLNQQIVSVGTMKSFYIIKPGKSFNFSIEYLIEFVVEIEYFHKKGFLETVHTFGPQSAPQGPKSA